MTPWTIAHQASLSMEFSRQEYWSGLPFPSPYMQGEKKVKSLSCVGLFVTPWTIAHQVPLSMEFSRQEYWGGSPLEPATSAFIWDFPRVRRYPPTSCPEPCMSPLPSNGSHSLYLFSRDRTQTLMFPITHSTKLCQRLFMFR